MGTNDDSWKFRKLGAGVSPTDYRETLSREGLLEYLKEREANFDEIYHQEYEKREVLISDIEALRASRDQLSRRLEAVEGALKPFANQMAFFEALAKTQGRHKPTHLTDQQLKDFQHTSLTLISNPINALRVRDFMNAATALAHPASGGSEGG